MTETPNDEGSCGSQMRHFDFARFCRVGVFVLLALAAMRVAKPVLFPILLALLLSFVLRPVHCALRRIRVGRVIAALIIMVALIATAVPVLLYLPKPVMNRAQYLAEDLRRAETKVRVLLKPLLQLRRLVTRVGELTEPPEEEPETNGETGAADEEQPQQPPPPRVEVKGQGSGFTGLVLGGLQDFFVMLVITFLLIFFFLAYGDPIYERICRRVGPIPFSQDITKSISRYLFTITVINTFLGVAIGMGMSLLDMPNPLLWGIIGALLNFIPYLGAIAGVAAALFVSLISFDSALSIALPPIVYFCLTSLEGNLITPMILGRRFNINPIVIFIWLIFWGWMWGIGGAVIAVPLLMTMKIVCDRVPKLRWFSDVIGLNG